MPPFFIMNFSQLMEKLKNIANSTDISFYIIGGAVRDMILEKEDITDVDISVEHRFSKFIDILMHELHADSYYISPLQTARVRAGHINMDIVTARKEYYEKPGMMPVIKPSNIDDDIMRRDFTVNSIAYDVRRDTFYDPLDGMVDLKMGLIRANRMHLFDEDPTRIFRLIRYSRRLGFTVETDTENDLMKSLKKKTLFENVSKSRISNEFNLMIKEDNARLCLEDMMTMNIMNIILGCHVHMNVSNYNEESTLIGNIVMMFLDNDIKTLMHAADILNNGVKKSQIADIKNIYDYLNGRGQLKHHIEKKYMISVRRTLQ